MDDVTRPPGTELRAPPRYLYKLLYETCVWLTAPQTELPGALEGCLPSAAASHVCQGPTNPPDLCCLMALRSVKLCHSSGFKHPGRPVLVLVLVPAPSQKLHTYNTAALFQSGAASLISCGCRGLIDSNATRGFKSRGEGGRTRQSFDAMERVAGIYFYGYGITSREGIASSI